MAANSNCFHLSLGTWVVEGVVTKIVNDLPFGKGEAAIAVAPVADVDQSFLDRASFPCG